MTMPQLDRDAADGAAEEWAEQPTPEPPTRRLRRLRAATPRTAETWIEARREGGES